MEESIEKLEKKRQVFGSAAIGKERKKGKRNPKK